MCVCLSTRTYQNAGTYCKIFERANNFDNEEPYNEKACPGYAD
jgi:hypothetical protein